MTKAVSLSALVAGCVPAGDFCDVASPLTYQDASVVEYLAKNDPDHLRDDLAHNEYGQKNCGWYGFVSLTGMDPALDPRD